MKVVLVNSPVICSTQEPPLGIAHIASYLQAIGVEVEVYDFSILDIGLGEISRILQTSRPDVVGISFLTSSRFAAFDIAKIAKMQGAIVVGGGPHISFRPEETLSGIPDFDFAVLGEGEITMREIIEQLLKGGVPDNIPGIAYKRNGSVFLNPPRSFIDNLDILPEPAWGLLPIRYYPQYSLMATRGCCSDCIFCNSPAFWQRKIRYFSVSKIVDWAHNLIVTYGNKPIRFRDDYFTANRIWIEEFCDEIIKRKLKIRWDCLGRVDSAEAGLFKKMRAAGCYKIAFGVEAGNERIMRVINKGITKDKVRNAVKLARRAGFDEIVTFFMLGHPEEKINELEDTYNFALELKGDLVSFKPAEIFPGTKLFDIAVNKGVLPKDFSWLERDKYKKGFCTDRDVPIFENPGLAREDLEAISKNFFVASFFDRIIHLNSLRDLSYFNATQLGLTRDYKDLLLFLNTLKRKIKTTHSLVKKLIVLALLVFIMDYKLLKSLVRRIKIRSRHKRSYDFHFKGGS